MSGYEASCPSCGAQLVFQLGSSLLKVCDHCGVAVARKGVDLATYGKVAQLIPTGSVLKLGLEGRLGDAAFTLVGRLQLSTGAGAWDEWLMGFGNGAWAWLSESQGKFHYLIATAAPALPAFSRLRPGSAVDLGDAGAFVVAEVREGSFASAEGELPFDVEPGSPLRYADLSGPGGAFGTLDYGSGENVEAVYVGRQVALAELGFHDLPDEADRRVRAAGGKLACPKCGGPIELRAPDRTERVGCPWCGSLLDATRDLEVLAALDKVPIRPLIPLGSKGRLRGNEWTLIGFMERSATVEGIRYPWREYLLYEPAHGFRWLVESDGHWSYVEEVIPADVAASGRNSRYDGQVFKHFQSSTATVDHVVGEFYWAVQQGDQVSNDDYTAPPRLLSKESDANEVHWSLGHYLTPREVKEAFAMPALPRDPRGVAANQPWPHGAALRSAWRVAAIAAVVLVMAFANACRSEVDVLSESYRIPATALPGAPEAATFSTPFVLGEGGALQISVTAPVNNSWLYLDGAVINEDTGEIAEFDLEAEYYHGVDSDGSWSEGSSSGSATVGSLTPGRYVVRMSPHWETGKNPGSYAATLTEGAASWAWFFLGLMGIFAWPVLLAIMRGAFETSRWSQSDYAE